jgi:hypothetical protein
MTARILHENPVPTRRLITPTDITSRSQHQLSHRVKAHKSHPPNIRTKRLNPILMNMLRYNSRPLRSLPGKGV